MITKEMQEALNAQVNAEMWSAYLYLSMSFMESELGYKGMSHWFREQYEEEMEHAFRITDYLEKQGAKVELKAIAAVKTEWKNSVQMFEESLRHEKKVTKMIRDLFESARKSNDYETEVFLQWFVTEQVEEEESVRTILEALTIAGEDVSAIRQLDSELGSR